MASFIRDGSKSRKNAFLCVDVGVNKKRDFYLGGDSTLPSLKEKSFSLHLEESVVE